MYIHAHAHVHFFCTVQKSEGEHAKTSVTGKRMMPGSGIVTRRIAFIHPGLACILIKIVHDHTDPIHVMIVRDINIYIYIYTCMYVYIYIYQMMLKIWLYLDILSQDSVNLHHKISTQTASRCIQKHCKSDGNN